MRIDMSNWMDKETAADYIGCHEMHIWRLIRRGELPCATYLTGKQGLWHKSALDDFLSKKLDVAQVTVALWKASET